MKQTNVEYLRGLAATYTMGTNLMISRNVIAGALEEMDAIKQPVPATRGLIHLAARIAEGYDPFIGPSFSSGIDKILDILTDAPEIIALQQAKESLEIFKAENEILYQNCIRIQNENRELKDAILHRESVIASLAVPLTGEIKKQPFGLRDESHLFPAPHETLDEMPDNSQRRKRQFSIHRTDGISERMDDGEPCKACHGGKFANAGLDRFPCHRCGGTGKELSPEFLRRIKAAVGVMVCDGKQPALDTCNHGPDNSPIPGPCAACGETIEQPAKPEPSNADLRTPAPWSIDALQRDGLSVVNHELRQNVCIVSPHGSINTRDIANARAIAAIPKLIAACEEMQRWDNKPNGGTLISAVLLAHDAMDAVNGKTNDQ